MYKAIGIAGIHTGVGKTIVSAILTAAMDADYWKPVQAGFEEGTDTFRVKKLLQGTSCDVHPEHIVLSHPMSPHAAASLENIFIKIEEIHLPETPRTLIVETAGGLMSPLNDDHTMLDLLKHLKLPVILVCSDYLGSINHTMLTYEVLQKHQMEIIGIVFCGKSNEESESFILNNTTLKLIGRIPFDKNITPEFIQHEAMKLKQTMKQF